MSALTALLHQRHTRAAVAIWAIVPTVFLFFALTLAVNPADNLDRLRIGVAVLDEGVVTPDGEISIGPRLLEGIGGQLGATAVPYPSEAMLSEAILAREVNLGIVVPAGMTEAVLAGAPVELRVIRTDANDAFVNAFSANLPAQLSANLAAILPSLAGSGETEAPQIAVGATTVAPTTDFRFPALPAALLLPVWMAAVAFGALLTRSGDAVRARFGAVRTGLAELGVTAVAGALVAAVITVDIALFSWHADLDLLGVFAILAVGLVAIGWLVVGTIRLVGLALGVIVGVTALFIQQPISGAATPASFAPDAVRWLEPVAPLRYLVEGMRNALIGGSTTADMLVALGALAFAGVVLAVAGMARLALIERRGQVHRETLATA